MSPELTAARARARTARTDLQVTIREVQSRLRPANLAEEAIDNIRRKGEAVADDAAAAVRKRPVAAGAVAAGLGALIGVRLLRRRRRTIHGDEHEQS
jgi:ElaB/YqjD/DUF883 family membrane-anchored ribosome-binding protein